MAAGPSPRGRAGDLVVRGPRPQTPDAGSSGPPARPRDADGAPAGPAPEYGLQERQGHHPARPAATPSSRWARSRPRWWRWTARSAGRRRVRQPQGRCFEMFIARAADGRGGGRAGACATTCRCGVHLTSHLLLTPRLRLHPDGRHLPGQYPAGRLARGAWRSAPTGGNGAGGPGHNDEPMEPPRCCIPATQDRHRGPGPGHGRPAGSNHPRRLPDPTRPGDPRWAARRCCGRRCGGGGRLMARDLQPSRLPGRGRPAPASQPGSVPGSSTCLLGQASEMCLRLPWPRPAAASVVAEDHHPEGGLGAGG